MDPDLVKIVDYDVPNEIDIDQILLHCFPKKIFFEENLALNRDYTDLISKY